MPFAAAVSQHPSPAEAVGEVVGAVLETLGPAPDLAVAVLSPGLARHASDVSAAIREMLAPDVLLGAVATTVVGGDREIEDGPALALWVAHLGAPVTPVRITSEESDGGFRVAGVPQVTDGEPRTLVLVADPFSLPLDGLLANLGRDQPHLAVVGGLASGARGPGGNRLLLDGEVHRDGAVGVVLPPSAQVTAIVSQGCRPVGDPMIVTAAEGPVLLELAGQPALDRLIDVGHSLPADDRFLFEAGPQVGVVVDESQEDFSTGDFLIRNVLGADAERRGLVIGAHVDVGTTVQFHVRDAASASEELRRLLAEVEPTGAAQAGALLFTCNGRGSAFFEEPDHDTGLLAGVVGSAVAGMACAGEIGPIGGRSHLHGYTASAVVISDAAP